MERFEDVHQYALARVVSDHKSIVLASRDLEAFKFENMWLQSKVFLELVKHWWQSYRVRGTRSFTHIQKIRLLKKNNRVEQ